MDSRSWHYEKTNSGTYIAFDGSEEDLDEFVETLLQSRISVKTMDRSFRPASNGHQYAWYVTLNEDHLEQDIVDAVQSSRGISDESSALSILKRLESLGVEVIASGDGIEFAGESIGFQPHPNLELKRYAKNKTKAILDILQYRGAVETPRKGLKWEEDEHDRVFAWLEQGRSVEEIAALAGRTPAAIEARFNLQEGEVDENDQPVDSDGSTQMLDELKEVVENSGKYSGKQLEKIQEAVERISTEFERDRQDTERDQNQVHKTLNQVIQDLTDLSTNFLELHGKLDSSSERDIEKLEADNARLTKRLEETTEASSQLLDELQNKADKEQEKASSLSNQIKELNAHSNPEVQQNGFPVNSSSDRKLTEATTKMLDVMTPNIKYLGRSIVCLSGPPKGFIDPKPMLKLLKKLSDDRQLPSTGVSERGKKGAGWKKYRRGKSNARIQTGETTSSRGGRLFYRNYGSTTHVIVDFKAKDELCLNLIENSPK